MFKKSLITAAVLSVSGAAMAQVTMSGALGFSYQKDRTTPKAVHGMQMTDGHMTVTAQEDLGGGYVATAKSEVKLRGRDTEVSGRNATVNLLTPVGLLTLGAVESANPLLARGFGGAPVSLPTGFDGGVISAPENVDVAAFNTKVGNLVIGLAYVEAGTSTLNALADSFGALNALTGGAAGNKVAGGAGAGGGPLKTVGLSTSYDNGALSVGLGITQDTVDVGTLQDRAAALLIKSGYDGRIGTHLSASYDFGVVKVGAGLWTKNKGWATETAFGVSMPLGAATVGLAYAAKTDDSETLGDGVTASQAASPTTGKLGLASPGLRAADVKGSAAKSGYAIGVDYALSKLTTINASYGVYDVKDANRPVNPTVGRRVLGSVTDEFRVRLMKTF